MVELNAEVAINDMAIPASVDAPGPLSATYEPVIGGGLSPEIKQAILDCFAHVAWVDPEGADYYNALHDLFFPPTELVRITAVYTQSGTVYPSTSLDSLKSDLVVKAVYSDGTTETLASTDYTLSGTLTVGTSTVTVSYSGKTTSFTVTVSAVPVVASISAVYTQSGTVYDTGTLDSLKSDLVVTATYTDSSTETVPSTDYTLSGTLAEGTSTITVTYETKTTTFAVTVTAGVPSGYTRYDYITGTKETSQALTHYITLKEYANLNDYSYVLEFGSTSSVNTSGRSVFGGRTASGSATSFAVYVNRTKAAFHAHGVDTSWVQDYTPGQKNIAVYTNTLATPSSVSVNDATPYSIAWGANAPINTAITVCCNAIKGSSTSGSQAYTQCGRLKLLDLSGNIVADYRPCVRSSDNAIGMYEALEGVFYTAQDVAYATAGGASTIYAVGNWS